MRKSGMAWAALAAAVAALAAGCGSGGDSSSSSAASSAAEAASGAASSVAAAASTAEAAGSSAAAEASSAVDSAAAGATSAANSGTAAVQPEGFKPPDLPMATSVGDGEGELNIIAWAGYAEDGSTDKSVDWVTPFEKATGCQVNVKIGNTSDEMVQLMKTGEYDGVSASGDATLRLIAAGDVAPVNVDLVPNYADVFAGLKDKPHNTVNGVHYGIPHGRGANVLMWRTDVVTTPPDSWSVVWDESSPYKGKVTAYDSPIYIADAALYLMATKPDLGITNPYELDDAQFQAAVDLLKAQNGIIGEYWSDYTKSVDSFTKGNSVVGTTWQVIANLLTGSKVPVQTVLPKEGSTGWSDTWMISSKAKHPNCMYRWMDWIISPKVNAQVAEWFGEAPANEKSCAETSDKQFCETYHAADEAYFSKVYLWTTPLKQCGDDRGDVCKDYGDWVKAWTEIKG